MKLPKLYRPISIRFSSLRNGVGPNMGVIFDIDTMVDRMAMRVICDGGWKWQIKNLSKLAEFDYFAGQDQEILNEIGMDLNCVSWA